MAYPGAVAPPPYSETVASPGMSTPYNNTVPATQVEISVSCRNLADMDVFSKSDPMVVMFTQGMGTKEWREFGRTEVIMNNLNPDFVKKFTIHYFFEEIQKLRFQVYDIDKKSSRLQDHDFIGEIECTLGSIVGENGGQLEKALLNKQQSKPRGKIILRCEEVSQCKDVATLQFRGHKLDKKDFFGKSDPFLVFYRCNEDNSFTAVHRTEVVKNTLNPTWKPFSVPARALCNGDIDRSIRIECYDWDRDGSHDLIGIFSTTLRELTSNPNLTFELKNPKKQAKKKSYKNSGTIILLQSKLEQQPTFLDFIKGGTQISFIVAIDFTASNGNPQNSNSLHFLNPYEPNQYVKALTSVGAICQDYDSDKLFPAFGFGARLPPNWEVSHEFALNGNPQNPFCERVEGVISSYFHSIQRVQLYGPTNFSPIIRRTVALAKESERQKPGEEYFVLLILTDGIISDMEQTKAAIVDAASLPVSIIIVGVGGADFEAMEELDGDEVRLSSRGRLAERDIVQFVPFRDFLQRGPLASEQLAKEVLAEFVPFRDYLDKCYGDITSGARLAKDVLEELPDQLTDYMKKRNIKPPSFAPSRS